MTLDRYTKFALRQELRAEFAKGSLWLVAGVAVSIVAYSAAPPGSRYLILWGAIGHGAFRFLRAVYYYLNPDAFLRR